MIQSEEIPSDPGFFKPIFFPKEKQITPVIQRTPITDKFNVFHSHFARLADIESFSQLRSQLIEIDINEELSVMGAGRSLELTLPVLGVVDLLDPVTSVPQPFASVLAINGYGARQEGEETNYPRPDFILVTDILGNQYEILINDNESIELPEEGAGLFSVPAALTLVFSEEQIKQGRGLANFQAWGAYQNKLYLLAPVELSEDFAITLCVSHLNQTGQRVVDSVRSIQIQFVPDHNHWQPSYLIHRHPEQGVFLELAWRGRFPYAPFVAAVTLEEGELRAQGWRQDPFQATRYIKRFGLNKETRLALAYHLYPLSSFMVDVLQEKSFLRNDRGYNQFLIWSEAVEIFYDVLIQDIANGRRKDQLQFDKLLNQEITKVDLKQLPAKFHDSVILEDLQSALAEGNGSLAATFLTNGENVRAIKERLFIATTEQVFPRVSVDFTHETEFSEAIITRSHEQPEVDCSPIMRML